MKRKKKRFELFLLGPDVVRLSSVEFLSFHLYEYMYNVYIFPSSYGTQIKSHRGALVKISQNHSDISRTAHTKYPYPLMEYPELFQLYFNLQSIVLFCLEDCE